jgi:hypothetical protein
MNIRATCAYLATLLEGLEITDPMPARIKRCWRFIPPARMAIADFPCAMLGYELQAVHFGSAIRQKNYSIHIQLLAGRAEVEADIAADIASAFLEALHDALSSHQRLGGTASVIRELRGASPETLTVLEWAGVAFVGLDLFLEVTLAEARVNAA